MNHVKTEFAMENLLFVTIILQLQDVLIENGYWQRMKLVNGSNDIPYACYTFDHIKLPNTIPLSPTVSRLKSHINATQKSDQTKLKHKAKCMCICLFFVLCLSLMVLNY